MCCDFVDDDESHDVDDEIHDFKADKDEEEDEGGGGGNVPVVDMIRREMGRFVVCSTRTLRV